MYIQRNKKSRKSGGHYETALLCHKYREEGVIKTKVLANLSMLPNEAVLTLETSLKAQKSGKSTFTDSDISVKKVVDFGYFFVILSVLRELRIDQLFDTLFPTQSGIIKLLIIGKIITRGSKLCIFNWINRNPFYAEVLGVDPEKLKLDEIYQIVGMLPIYQSKIEKKWGVYNKTAENEIFLYDITSSYFEGTTNALAAFGYNRDGKKGKMQITIGLITDYNGFPLKIEVFDGNINDHKTVESQLKELKATYGAQRIIFVGDRGMKIRYNLDQMNEQDREGIEYITGLTKDEIKSLLKKDVFQLDLFSSDLVEVTDGDTRYVLSVNPELSKEKRRFRNLQRDKFEDRLSSIQQKWQKRKDQIEANKQKLKEGHKNKKLVTEFKPTQIEGYKKQIILLSEKYRMNTYYSVTVDCNAFRTEFDFKQYSNDKNLDGLYVIATNVKPEKLTKKEIRAQYKNLKHVENAFREMKSVRLNIRPIFHVNEAQTRGHILLSMFSFAIIYQLEQAIFPFLKDLNKQLSYNDLAQELEQIKIVEFKLGKNVHKIQFTDLTENQKRIFQLLKIKESDLLKFIDVATNRKKIKQ